MFRLRLRLRFSLEAFVELYVELGACVSLVEALLGTWLLPP
jgi:hypothetical protein